MTKTTKGQELVINGIVIQRRESDGYINATQMCKAGGKLFGHYLELSATKDIVNELSSDIGIPISELIQSVKGGNPNQQGTWIHEDLAMNLAQWISSSFALKVSRWLMRAYKETIKAQSEKPSHLELLIADATRSWEKTFSDKLWVELARLTRFKGDPFRNRPSHWGKLVRDLIYMSLDEDLYGTLKEKKANTNNKLHQGLTKEIGVKVLQSHIDEIVGIARVCDNVVELRNVVKERYSKKPVQTNLKLYLA